MCDSYVSGMYVWIHVYVAGVCDYLVLQTVGGCDRCIDATGRTLGMSCMCMYVAPCFVDVKVWGGVRV